mgnify:CR=1 FL=1
MARKFEILTRYIQQMKDDKFGDWIIDRENDGTPERPIHMPFVNYSERVESFLRDVSQFMEDNKDLELYRYREILEDNGIEWGSVSMSEADVSSLNEKCVMALIMGAIRAERFCDGALLDFFQDGSILKWLERLKEIDEQLS